MSEFNSLAEYVAWANGRDDRPKLVDLHEFDPDIYDGTIKAVAFCRLDKNDSDAPIIRLVESMTNCGGGIHASIYRNEDEELRGYNPLYVEDLTLDDLDRFMLNWARKPSEFSPANER